MATLSEIYSTVSFIFCTAQLNLSTLTFLSQNFNFELASPECSIEITFWGKYFFKMFFIPMIFVVLISILLIQELSVILSVRSINERLRVSWHICQKFIPTFISLCCAMHTFVVSSAIDPVNCVRMDFQTSAPVYAIVSSPSFHCYNDLWFHFPLVLLFCFFYGIAFPVLVGYILFKNRNNLYSPAFLRGYGSLYRSLRYSLFFWELVIMLKKVSFVLVIRVLSSRQNSSYGERFASAISIIGFFFALEAMVQPYSGQTTNFRSSTHAI
jgi:hypothetical protein